jgi:hypothetical protein
VLRTEEDAELERHVETREMIDRVERRAGQVMDAERAVSDDLVELLDPYLAPVIAFEGAASDKTALVDREHECVKEFQIVAVERDVDEGRLGCGSGTQAGYRFLEPEAFAEPDFRGVMRFTPVLAADFPLRVFLAESFVAEAFRAPPRWIAGPK